MPVVNDVEDVLGEDHEVEGEDDHAILEEVDFVMLSDAVANPVAMVVEFEAALLANLAVAAAWRL